MAGLCCYGSPHPILMHSFKSDFYEKRASSLRCCSTPTTTTTKSSSKKPNPNPTPTPELLKLAVNGLTELLRIFSSGNGSPRLDTENYARENEVSVSNIDDVVMILKLDYANSYFVTGIFTSAIYVEDCLFEDPTIKFRGTNLYSRNLKLLVPFFDNPSIVLQKIEKGSNSETSFVSATWNLRTFLRLPWRPLISVNGSTLYELNDNFRIVRHAEGWDISALQAIGQIFTPSFLAHRE